MAKSYRCYVSLTIMFGCLYFFAIVMVFFVLGVPPSDDIAFTHGIMQKKVSYAQSLTKRKIMIVSGSNGLFGVQAKLIAKKTGLNAVNMAVRASLGTDYIFYKAKQVSHPGDVIIMPLEYGLYLYNTGLPSSDLVNYVFSYDLTYFYSLSLTDKIEFIKVFSQSDLLFKVVQILRPSSADIVAANAAKTLTAEGDEVKNIRGVNEHADRIKRIDSYVPDDYEHATLNTLGIDSVSQFAVWCKINKIQLFAAFPSLLYIPQYKTPGAKKYFDELVAFYGRQGVPVLGHPYNFMYGKNQFYNSVYHLYSDAAEKRTYQILDLLKKSPDFEK